MGILDSLNPASLVSSAAESICDALLPKDLEFVGDLVKLGIDFDAGNWLRCFHDAQDLFQDLPQQLSHLAAAAGAAPRPGLTDDLLRPSFLEPGPPPSRATPSTAGAAPWWLPTPSSGPRPDGVQAVPASAAQAASTDAEAFFRQSDAALMNAVRNGRLPPSITGDPAQMRRLDARMNDITQMNQLITNMLKALHDMNSQVIQNLRV